MVTLVLKVNNEDGLADTLSRRFVADLRDAPGVADAWLVRHEAAEGERGIIEEIGAFGVSLATGQGAAALVSFARAALSRSGEREIQVRLPDGTEFALKGSDVSDAAFDKATAALLSIISARSGGETA